MKLDHSFSNVLFLIRYFDYVIIRLGFPIEILRMPFYGVAKGKVPGVYHSWAECQKNVLGIQDALFKKFNTQQEAEQFVKNKSGKLFIEEVQENDCLIIESESPYAKKAKYDGKAGTTVAAKKAVGRDSTVTEKDLDHSKSLKTFPDRAISIAGLLPVMETPLVELEKIGSDLPLSIKQYIDNYCNLQMQAFDVRIRSIEEKVEALESVNALIKYDTGFDPTEKSNEADTVVNKKDSIKEAKHGSSSSSSLRKRILQQALEPKAVGSSRFSSSLTSTSKLQNSQKSDPTNSESIQSEFPFRFDSNNFVEVYVDGSCTRNGQRGAKAGIGVWFNDDHPLNVSRPVLGKPTNNVAEIQAATRAVEKAGSAGIKKLSILTDSMFTINCITKWMSNWKKNKWITSTGQPVVNKIELLELEKACETFRMEVKWTHVDGHTGIYGNEKADILAKAGAERYKPV